MMKRPRVPEEIPNGGEVGNHAYRQESGTSQQGIALSRFANWWSETRSRYERRVNSSATIVRENKPPKCFFALKVADTSTEFNQAVGVDLFVLADSNEQVFKFLNIVALATRFNICFPVPSKRPGGRFVGT